MGRLLTVITGADHLKLKDGTIRPTGSWAEEFAVPHEKFRTAGVDVDVATPGGVQPPSTRRAWRPR